MPSNQVGLHEEWNAVNIEILNIEADRVHGRASQERMPTKDIELYSKKSFNILLNSVSSSNERQY